MDETILCPHDREEVFSNASGIPQLHRATIAAVGRLLADYESFVCNQHGPLDQTFLSSFDKCESEDAYLYSKL